MQIPKHTLKPFGYTGVPVLSRKTWENDLQILINKMDAIIERRKDQPMYIQINNPEVIEMLVEMGIFK